MDWGRKRFGVALSDPGRIIAHPLVTLARRAGKRPPIAALLELIREHDVTGLVVGLPLSPDGEETETTAEVRAFGAALARRAGLPLDYQDERLTTALALRAARAAGNALGSNPIPIVVPCHRIVGTSGSSGSRTAPVTASAFNLPVFTCGMEPGVEAKVTWISPLIKSSPGVCRRCAIMLMKYIPISLGL